MADPDEPRWPAWVDEWVLPYVREPGLLPAWFALAGHIVVAVAGLLLLGWRGWAGGWFLSGALMIGTLWVVRHELRVERRPGSVTAALAVCWAASIGLAWLAESTGIF